MRLMAALAGCVLTACGGGVEGLLPPDDAGLMASDAGAPTIDADTGSTPDVETSDASPQAVPDVCVPSATTCAQQCGYRQDGCGHSVFCGACADAGGIVDTGPPDVVSVDSAPSDGSGSTADADSGPSCPAFTCPMAGADPIYGSGMVVASGDSTGITIVFSDESRGSCGAPNAMGNPQWGCFNLPGAHGWALSCCRGWGPQPVIGGDCEPPTMAAVACGDN